MLQFVFAIVIVFGVIWLLRTFAYATPAQIRGMRGPLAGMGLIGFAGFLALRGGLGAAIPIFMAGLGLLGKHMVYPNGFPWNQKTPGQKSRVATSVLAMELDHDTGGMEGEVLSGPLRGRTLSALSDAELLSLHRLCDGSTGQSRMLLESWLDRFKPNWRQDWEQASGAKRPEGGRMSRDEAYAVLALKPGATTNEVRAAHRRLMKDYHPDHGGSGYIAAKINQAKDVLLGE